MPATIKPFLNHAGSAPADAAADRASAFSAMSARRLYIFGGIALIAGGLLFGDIFAVFVLHQNAARQGEALIAASRAVAAGDAAAVNQVFTHLGDVLEDRGTKVDAHVHMIGAGYLALLLGLVQPYIAFSRKTKKSLAVLFIAGGILLPIGIFLIHYVGLGEPVCRDWMGERAGGFLRKPADRCSPGACVGLPAIPARRRNQRSRTPE